MKRRSVLQLGAAAAVLSIAGAGLALVQPGLSSGKLSAASRDIFAAAASAILDGTLPTDAPAHDAAITGLLNRVDALVAGLPAHAQGELSQLLALLASGAGRRILAGLDTAWPAAAPQEVRQALQSMRVSGLSLRRQTYQALHDIVGSAYFADPGTWPLLGYPGPLPV